MTKVRHPAACTVLPSSSNFCNCGNRYERLQHEIYPLTYPHCLACDEAPSFYKLRKVIHGRNVEVRFTSTGKKLKSLEQCYHTAHEMQVDADRGEFNPNKYKRRVCGITVADTVSDFIRDHIFPRQKELHLTLEDKVWIEDWMEPFMEDVGIFVVSEIHLRDFIRTFRFKGYDLERAERLFQVIKQEIRL